jgi:tRNA dimethylallyltransferase
MSREALYRRIDRRVDNMMAQGLLAEVERLAAAGYGWNTPAMSGLGYRQIGQFLRGEVSLEEAVALIKKETRRFVRQQYNWFRLEDRRLHWFDVEQGVDPVYDQIKELVAGWLRKP